MSRIRVHQLAREFGIKAKDLIERLENIGVREKRAQSFLKDAEVASIREALAAVEKPQGKPDA